MLRIGHTPLFPTFSSGYGVEFDSSFVSKGHVSQSSNNLPDIETPPKMTPACAAVSEKQRPPVLYRAEGLSYGTTLIHAVKHYLIICNTAHGMACASFSLPGLFAQRRFFQIQLQLSGVLLLTPQYLSRQSERNGSDDRIAFDRVRRGRVGNEGADR